MKTYIYNEFTNEYGEDVKYLTLSWKPLTVKERKALKLLVDKQKQMKKEMMSLKTKPKKFFYLQVTPSFRQKFSTELFNLN